MAAEDTEASIRVREERGNGQPDGLTVDYKRLGSLTAEETALLHPYESEEDDAAVFDGEKWVEAAVRSEWKSEAETVADNAAKVEVFDPNPDLPPLPDKTLEETAADQALVNRDEDHTKLGTPSHPKLNPDVFWGPIGKYVETMAPTTEAPWNTTTQSFSLSLPSFTPTITFGLAAPDCTRPFK